ncbi:MAG: hypothetical protein KF718_03840 [Polyangiaceae bacterium]|nr:hypothetical protein [Polyangiaceae bacterium]
MRGKTCLTCSLMMALGLAACGGPAEPAKVPEPEPELPVEPDIAPEPEGEPEPEPDKPSAAEPEFPENAGVEEAIAAIKQGGTRENLDADALGTPLMNMKLYEPCKPKPNQKVTIRVAIWDGRAVGVDVSVGPKGDDKLASCIKEQIRTVTWRDKVKSLNTVDYAF